MLKIWGQPYIIKIIYNSRTHKSAGIGVRPILFFVYFIGQQLPQKKFLKKF